MRTFRCQFSKDLSCKVAVSDNPPERGTSHIQLVEWDGKPSPKFLRPYIAWMNSVNKTLADEWGIIIMYTYLTPAPEIWIFEPGKPPEKQDE